MSSFKVLVVDDERDFLESLVRRLQRRSVDAAGVTSGEAALEHLEREKADVVVLDVKMPGMNGIEALRQIKQCHPEVEVILLTGHASVESGVEGLALEAFDYLIKPVKLDELIERIMEAFDRRKVVGELTGSPPPDQS
ncbi:MAG: response regulator [Desulfarculaceae bacterium]|nr:response regulator [Desulfarculaceae bacterium]MCF8049411.1 response regulator [Desulfarculaceae bacterium]MCF8066400.1 response regulator [Desulfarculaceae bacterium]MCF8097246.1 response regulator [Desulfarculaceae bacterium]MCF8122139.1 response regulator [Desulfarculaceae bacterium]